MKCVYINLDRATARREAVEAGFARVAPPGWELVRFPAVDGRALTAAGSTSAAEVGCFLSHRNAIASTLDDPDPVFIVEDDIVFSDRCFPAIDAKLGRPDWDVLFTEVLPTDLNLAIHMARAYPDKLQRSAFERIRLSGRSFAGATGYVVNGASKAGLVELLDEAGPNLRAYDLALRELVAEKRLRAWVMFPFVTSLANQPGDTQIQPQEAAATDFVLLTLRRLYYVDRDYDACRQTADEIRREYHDPTARVVADVLGAMASPRFTPR